MTPAHKYWTAQAPINSAQSTTSQNAPKLLFNKQLASNFLSTLSFSL